MIQIHSQRRREKRHTQRSRRKDAEEIRSPHAKMYPNQERRAARRDGFVVEGEICEDWELFHELSGRW